MRKCDEKPDLKGDGIPHFQRHETNVSLFLKSTADLLVIQRENETNPAGVFIWESLNDVSFCLALTFFGGGKINQFQPLKRKSGLV